MPWSKNFDVDEALQKAGEAFWNKGYQGTSMHDLLDAMGIQKGSFYDTYGSKQEAYLRALERYTDERLGHFANAPADCSPRAALEAMFQAILKECVGADGHRGCMIVNCALELAHEDEGARQAVQAALRTHENLIKRWLRDAQAAGEVSATLDPGASAKALMAFILAMRVYSRAGCPKATIRTFHDQAIALLDA